MLIKASYCCKGRPSSRCGRMNGPIFPLWCLFERYAARLLQLRSARGVKMCSTVRLIAMGWIGSLTRPTASEKHPRERTHYRVDIHYACERCIEMNMIGYSSYFEPSSPWSTMFKSSVFHASPSSCRVLTPSRVSHSYTKALFMTGNLSLAHLSFADQSIGILPQYSTAVSMSSCHAVRLNECRVISDNIHLGLAILH